MRDEIGSVGTDPVDMAQETPYYPGSHDIYKCLSPIPQKVALFWLKQVNPDTPMDFIVEGQYLVVSNEEDHELGRRIITAILYQDDLWWLIRKITY